MEHDAREPHSSPSAPEKPPRSKVERAIVWSLIGLLLVFAGVEGLARFGYTKTVNNLESAIDKATEPLTLDDFQGDIKAGLPIQGTGEHEGQETVLFTWPSLVKKYELHLTLTPDGSGQLDAFAPGSDPAESIRYRTPVEDSGNSLEESMAAPGGGGPGGGGPGGGGGRGARNPLQRLVSEPVVAELNLNEEQKAKLTELIENSQIDPMVSVEERAAQEAMQRKEALRQMQAFLDEKQFIRAKQILLHARGLEALGDEEIAQDLALTPEQQEQIAAINAAHRQKQQTIREETEGAALRERTTTLREETDRELLAVLTDDQKQAWETLLGPAPPEPERRQRPQ